MSDIMAGSRPEGGGARAGEAARARVLVVEDEMLTAADLAQTLAALGYEVAGICGSGEDALELIAQGQPDIVLMDIVLRGEIDGVAAAQTILKKYGIPVVYLTAHTDDAVIERAKITEPFGYIIKPFEEHELRIFIEMALYKHRADAALRRSHQRFRSLMEYAADPFVVHGAGGEILDVNHPATTLTGYGREEMLGMRLEDLFVGQEGGSGLREAWERAGPSAPVTVEASVRQGNGGTCPVELRIGLLDTGEERIYLTVARDITERKALEAEREALIRTLKGTIEQVKSMRGVLPLCVMKQQFTTGGEIEALIRKHYDSVLSCGICQNCVEAFKRV